MNIQIYDRDKLAGNDCIYMVNPPSFKYKINEMYAITDEDINLFVNEAILDAPQGLNNYGILTEPRCVKPQLYTILYHNSLELKRRVKKVFTSDEELLKSPMFELLPFLGGSFIRPEDTNIHKKNKMLSIVVSEKRYAEGHKLRHAIVAEEGYCMDTYGPDYTSLYTYPEVSRGNTKEYYNYVTGGLDRVFKNYRYSIAIENQKSKHFFSEKIVNCFATGTIPIYWGAETIADYFNPEGIITFDTLDDLKNILFNLSEEQYLSMKPAIEDNFARHFEYISFDDYLLKKINEYRTSLQF